MLGRRQRQRQREMKKAELVFLPATEIGHLVSTVELAKRLIDQFSITVLVMSGPFQTTTRSYTESVSASSSIRFIELPEVDPPPPGLEHVSSLSLIIENNKPNVKRTISNLLASESKTNSVPFAGLVVGMFTTTMIDIAHELGIPSYLYCTSGAATLGLMLHLPAVLTQLKDNQGELKIPCFVNSVPPLALPSLILSRKGLAHDWFLNQTRRYRDTKGIIVNSFSELESHAINSFDDGRTPPVYPVGPVLDIDGQTHSRSDRVQLEKIMKWLDDQPSSSVVFLCFGSRGSFSAPQVQEIAIGLERSGFRFLWSLRRPPTSKIDGTSDYTNPDEVLPDGFLKRTEGRGLVCGWAPQVSILAHEAIGGFVSHCGWNSTLESLWFGVPILTWPLYAEQQLNAFELVEELGLAVEIRSNYMDSGDLIRAEEIEKGVRCLMESDNEVRRRTKEMKEKSRKTLKEGETSFESLSRFIGDVMESL